MSPNSLHFWRVKRRPFRSKRPPVRSKRPTTTDTQIARIDALTATGRTNWFALLAYLAFVTVTTLGVEDVDFFVESRQTELPIVGVSIPTSSFFLFAPVLGAALYAYLHLHIRKVTEALGRPPLGPPPLVDGAPLETRIKPWLLNDFVLRQRRDGAVARRPLDTLSWLTTWALIWFAGPFVLGLMWWRSWPAHDLLLSTVNALCLMAALYAGTLSWTKMCADTGCRASPRVVVATALIVLLCLPVAWLTAANSKGIFEWVIAHDPDADDATRTWAQRQEAWAKRAANDAERTFYDGLAVWAWNTATGFAKLDAPNLSAARLSVLPPEHADLDTARHRYRTEWCQRNGLPPAICGGNPAASEKAVEVLWQARERWCAEAGFSDCRAHFGTLNDDFDNREWPAFRTAMIAAIDKPDLSGKDLRAARLADADLSGIDLSTAYLAGANLFRARLEGANLFGARLEGADLTGARLEGANLFGARLEGANLSGARLEGADLSLSTLTGTADQPMTLRSTNLSAVINNGGALRFVDLRLVISGAASTFRNSFADATVLLPESIEPPCQWVRERLSDADFFARWRGWVEAAPNNQAWHLIAPEQWSDVEPKPPPAGCEWHE